MYRDNQTGRLSGAAFRLFCIPPVYNAYKEKAARGMKIRPSRRRLM
jgi:hypothetical protein